MSRRLTLMLGLLLLVSAACTQPTVATPANISSTIPGRNTSAMPVVSCEVLADLALPDTTAISAASVPAGPFDPPGSAPAVNLPAYCRVVLKIKPQITIEVWLPTDTYNSRFQAVGGGGYAGWISYDAMTIALRSGYATASTDTGYSETATPGGSFALNPDGTLNSDLIEDFASRSLIELTKKAKTLIATFYGHQPIYSYWNGCSTGGQQGLMLAQRFPEGYDGILAGAPAINWDRFIPAELWPQVVMQQELGGPIAQCKLAVASDAAVDHCSGLDGILEDPRQCDFDPRSLIGSSTDCGTFTEADARVIQMIWDGPRTTGGRFLWYGLAKGTPLDGLAGTDPFPIAVDYLRYWIKQDPAFDGRTLGYAGFRESFRESQRLFNDVIGTDEPNLSAFRRAGGKLIIWHGWNDQLIFPEGTINYYSQVIRANFYNTRRVQQFARLFMAPGVFHCGGGTGPSTFDLFGALVQWVENGKAPDRIIASDVAADGTIIRTWPLCAYPSVARYDGKGNRKAADSFKCKPNFGV